MSLNPVDRLKVTSLSPVEALSQPWIGQYELSHGPPQSQIGHRSHLWGGKASRGTVGGLGSRWMYHPMTEEPFSTRIS